MADVLAEAIQRILDLLYSTTTELLLTVAIIRSTVNH